ncbi:GNAT family N-acetyltransferase [Pelomonas sp. APW6]|uniref:GNAT family N-acetyltransferase n=1 Tax=Roseateles subflavus TaxID=3053353 RepID=A0ABT7LMT6_9BURK|nr:GNAT family N-acetyltransferase [Pelomonas sp. APW6]MDL5034175.1 GNAT family N-acetyltransferase [Pelomonas sp. APW6]
MDVRHDPAAQQFWLEPEPGQRCVLDYQRQGDAVVFTHTGVPPALQGQGLAARLVAAGLQWAGEQGLRVVPACSYVASYLNRQARRG